MTSTYVLTGTMTGGTVIQLDEAVPLTGKVRIVVETLPADESPSYDQVMEMIRARQKARGHVPSTREEVDAYLRAERAGWDD